MSKQINKINGPFNLVRMEGYVNNIHKVIYLFMDKHVDIDKQTDCNDPDNSINITEYLKKNFINIGSGNKTYDFFLETFPHILAYKPNELLHLSEPDFQRTYIENLWKFFYENIVFDPKSNKLSSLFKNVRLHYIDIRDVLYPVLLQTLEFAKINLKENHEYVPDMINTALKIILEFMIRIEEMLRTNNNDSLKKKQTISKLEYGNYGDFLQKPEILNEYLEHILYLINKLLNNFKHDNIKKLINDYVEYYLLFVWQKYIHDLSALYNKIKYLTPKDYQKFKDYLEKKLNKFQNKIRSYISNMVDLYFLRRFLDKDYITNAIVYTGAAHSVIYIYILHSIGFKITHCANCNIKDINELNMAVSKIKNFPFDNSIFDLLELFIKPNMNQYQYQYQCIDISNFPKNFI